MPDFQLDDKQLKQLDGNIKKMISAGASQDDVMRYASDFKNQFGVKKKDQAGVTSGEVSAPIPSKLPSKGVLEQGVEFAQKGFTVPQSMPDKAKTEQGWLLNTVSALDKGFAKNLVGSPVKGLGQLIEGTTKKVVGGTGKAPISDALIKFGDYFNNAIDELTPQDEEFKNSLSDQFGQAFGQVASLIATGGITGAAGKTAQAAEMAAQMAPKGTAAATAIKTLGSELSAPTAVSAGLSMGQSEFDKAKQAGATDDQAFEAFYKNAAVGSVLEAIPVMQFFKRFNKSTGGSVANYIKTKGVAGLTGGIEEMTTEVMQQLYANKTAKDIYNINQDIFDEVGSSGGVGFGVGFLLNAMGANAKILKKQGKDQQAAVLENQAKQFENDLKNPKVTSSNKESALKIVNQGLETGARKAAVNLNKDLINEVITPEQHEQGLQFIEKATQVIDKLPVELNRENKAKSIELLVSRDDLKNLNESLLQKKSNLDEAYHAGIDEEIKANEDKIKNINSELYNITKLPQEETVSVISPEENVAPEIIDVENVANVVMPEQNVPGEAIEISAKDAVVEKPKLADKIASFKEKYNLVSDVALKGMETKRINQEAAKIVPMDKESAVLAWLAGKGNELNWKAINEAAGRTETARLNVGKDYSTEEVKLRDYASKERNKGLTLRDAAHKIWEDVSKRNPNITSDEVEEALLTAIRENPTRTDAARSLISISGAETAPMSIEEGELAYYQRKGEEAPQEEPFYLESGFVPFQEEEGLEEAPFAVQEKALDEVNDMKDIVKDLVEEGVLNLNTIKNRVAKELGYDSKRLRQTVDKAYQEYTKESTPKEVTSGVIGKVGTFLSDLFGGKAKDRVFVAKDGKSLMAKYAQIAETGGRVEFQATLPNGETVTAKPIDASVVNGFYSPLELQINQMKQDKMPAKQWLDKLRGEEAKWTGLSDWLSQQEGSLTKENIKNWLQDNQIEINEIVKGQPDLYNKSSWDFASFGDGRWTFNFSRGGYFQIDASEGDGFARLYVQNPGSGWVDEIGSVEYYDRDQILDIVLEKNYFENYLDNERLTSTRYGKYTVEGDKSDYKEILITLPGKSKDALQKKLDQFYDEEQKEINKERAKYVSDLGLDPNKKQLYFFALNDDNDVIYLAKDANDLDKWKDSHLYAMSVQQEAPAGLKNALQFNKYFNVTNDALEKIRIKINDLEKEINKKDKTDTKYKSSHFDEANILVHVRSDIRTDSKGNKIYFIEEVQSDWGQEGKKKGFLEEISSKDLERYEELKPIVKKLDDTDNDIRQASIYINGGSTSQEALDISKFLSLSIDERKSKIEFIHNQKQAIEYNIIESLKKDIEKNNKEVGDKIDEELILQKELNKYERFLETVKNNREFDQANEEWNNIFKEIRKLKSEQQNLEELTFGLNKEIAKANERIGFDNFYYEKAIKSSDLEFDSVEYFKIKNEYQKLNDKIIDQEGINKAPFVTKTNDWAKLGLKVALKNAVESGASKIAWTNGEQQNERYDLSKEVDYIKRINKDENSFYLDISMPRGMINLVVDNNGVIESQRGSMLSSIGNYVDKNLSDLIGKDIADRVLSNGDKTYAGENLKIGGKGMIGFYGSPNNNSLGILGDLAKSLYKQNPEKLSLQNNKEDKLKSLKAELDEYTANKTNDFRFRDFWITEGNKENADFYEKRAKQYAEYEESVLREIKRLGVEYQYSIDITPELKAQVEVGLPLFMSTPDGADILGFTFANKVYLNGEKLNPNTPIHEAGHIWTEWVKQNDPKVYEKGIELVKNSDYLKEVKSSKFYQDQAKKLGSKSEVEFYFQHEALAMAIGDKGAQFVTESKKASFKDWLNELWGKIKSIVGFKDITPEELQNLTFDEFTKMAVKDILGEQFEGRSLQEAYDMLPNGKKLRQNKENTLIKNNFENIVNELIKKKKIQKIC